MKTKDNFLISFGVATLGYLFVYLVLNDAPLYLLGGAIVGSLYEVSNKKIDGYLSVTIWLVLLGLATMLYYKFKSKPVKYFFLLLIFMLLYVVDFILYDIMSFDTTERMIVFLNVAAMILIKGLALSLIIYFEERNLRKS